MNEAMNTTMENAVATTSGLDKKSFGIGVGVGSAVTGLIMVGTDLLLKHHKKSKAKQNDNQEFDEEFEKLDDSEVDENV